MTQSLFAVSQPSTLDQIKQINAQCLFQMKLTAQRTFDLVWKNRTKAQIQAIFDELGPLGGQSFELHYSLQTFIKSLDASYVMLTPPYQYSINQETGIVTIGDLIS